MSPTLFLMRTIHSRFGRSTPYGTKLVHISVQTPLTGLPRCPGEPKDVKKTLQSRSLMSQESITNSTFCLQELGI